jgi:hypothetical protein
MIIVHPLWDTLDASAVVTEGNADVLGTDVSGASEHTTAGHSGLFSDLNDESLRLLKQLKLDMRRTEVSGLSVVGTPAPAEKRERWEQSWGPDTTSFLR